MAKLPKALQRTVDAGNAILADAARAGALKGGEALAQQPPAQDPPTPPTDAPPAEQVTSAVTYPVLELPTTPAAPAPAPEGDETWQQRYKTLQGKYTKEIGEFRQQMSDAERRMNDLDRSLQEANRTIIALNARLTTPAEPPAPPPTPRKLVSDQEVEEYRPEFMDVVGRRAQEVVLPELDRFNRIISDLQQQVKTVSGKVQTVDETITARTHEEFINQLTGALPDWREQNADPLFLQYLADTRDPVFNRPLQEALDDAVNSRDTARVVRIFQGYHGSAAPSAPAAPTPKPNGNGGRVNLETLAAPGRTRQPATREPAAPPVLTPAEVARFNNDVMKGRYKNRPQERAEMERRIEAAHMAGTLQSAIQVPY